MKFGHSWPAFKEVDASSASWVSYIRQTRCRLPMHLLLHLTITEMQDLNAGSVLMHDGVGPSCLALPLAHFGAWNCCDITYCSGLRNAVISSIVQAFSRPPCIGWWPPLMQEAGLGAGWLWWPQQLLCKSWAAFNGRCAWRYSRNTFHQRYRGEESNARICMVSHGVDLFNTVLNDIVDIALRRCG